MNYIIKQLFLKDKRSRVEKFRNILSFASTILEGEHPNIIYDLIYSLGKPYQLKIINDCIMGNSISPDTAFREEHLFFKHANDKYRLRKTDTNGSFINFHQHLRNNTLSPTSTLIYTFPWSNERLRNAFNNIGGKVGNPWINDSLNHRVTKPSLRFRD